MKRPASASLPVAKRAATVRRVANSAAGGTPPCVLTSEIERIIIECYNDIDRNKALLRTVAESCVWLNTTWPGSERATCHNGGFQWVDSRRSGLNGVNGRIGFAANANIYSPQDVIIGSVW